MENNMNEYQSEYSDKKFWEKVGNVAKKAGIKVIYMALLLYYVLADPDVSKYDKAKVYGALGYFILPIDLIPDFIPVVGYTDDLAALVWATHAVWKNITPEMKQKAEEQLHEWFGDYDKSTLHENSTNEDPTSSSL
jgi:uncharacterized membrane protein YkvA (DUF1232 family)